MEPDKFDKTLKETKQLIRDNDIILEELHAIYDGNKLLIQIE